MGLPIPGGAACVASVIIWHPTPPATAVHAYWFATELFLVGLLLVSTIRFPSFKKRAASPRAAMVTSLSIVLVFALMILFQQAFFVGFFAAYVTLTLAMNLAWKAGWRGIEPPHDLGADPETVH
jgi:CDP-diacylglycerol--serine O-phosphatidyltransferase